MLVFGCRFLDRFVRDCGYACGWAYPYGFVPEADCPVHDKYPMEGA